MGYAEVLLLLAGPALLWLGLAVGLLTTFNCAPCCGTVPPGECLGPGDATQTACCCGLPDTLHCSVVRVNGGCGCVEGQSFPLTFNFLRGYGWDGKLTINGVAVLQLTLTSSNGCNNGEPCLCASIISSNRFFGCVTPPQIGILPNQNCVDGNGTCRCDPFLLHFEFTVHLAVLANCCCAPPFGVEPIVKLVVTI